MEPGERRTNESTGPVQQQPTSTDAQGEAQGWFCGISPWIKEDLLGTIYDIFNNFLKKS